MQKTKVKILEVQPHNPFLAEETLASLRERCATGWIWHPIEVVDYKGIKMSYNGDHRLYIAYERGDETIDAIVYSLSDAGDKKKLCQKEYDKWLNFVAFGRDGILDLDLLVEFYRQWGTQPKGDEFDIKRFMHIIGFMEHNKVHSIADVRFLPTKKDIELAYESLDKEYRIHLRKHRRGGHSIPYSS